MPLYLSRGTIPAECERCGRKVDINELREEVVKGRPIGNRVCGECYDPDHPQNWAGTRPVNDKQSVKDASPPPNLREDRSLWGFNPVGALGNVIIAETGVASVTTV